MLLQEICSLGMTSIIDVAKLAGVSKSTVSRVLNPGSSVSPAAKEKVEQAISALNYRPNNFARGLKSNKSNMVGLVLVNVSSPYYAQMLGGAQNQIEGLGKEILVASGFGEKRKEIDAINALSARQCDGLLVYLETEFTEADLPSLKLSNAPIVTMGMEEPLLSKNSVQIDNEFGGYLAAKHLLDNGHRKILFLGGPEAYLDARRRKQGFLNAMNEMGVDEDEFILESGEYDEYFGYQSIKTHLEEKSDFTAICAGDDDIAAGVLAALREAKIAVPEQISVIGYDDNFHAKHTYPALTTIRQPISELGANATQLLIEVMGQPEGIGRHLVLRPELVIRDSVTAKIER